MDVLCSIFLLVECHNSVHGFGCHSIVIVVDFCQNWLCCKFLLNILISFVHVLRTLPYEEGTGDTVGALTCTPLVMEEMPLYEVCLESQGSRPVTGLLMGGLENYNPLSNLKTWSRVYL